MQAKRENVMARRPQLTDGEKRKTFWPSKNGKKLRVPLAAQDVGHFPNSRRGGKKRGANPKNGGQEKTVSRRDLPREGRGRTEVHPRKAAGKSTPFLLHSDLARRKGKVNRKLGSSKEGGGKAKGKENREKGLLFFWTG